MLIFVLQTIWLYIKELAGKDLDIFVVGKFLIYFAPKLIPLVLPLTILLASIMVFGNFAENYEFAAMKSTGISLHRAMAGLSIFIVILAAITFFFSNNVIPWAEYNSYNLRKNIAKLKPAMVIAEGQFNEIGNITIKVDEKSGDRGQYLKGVVLHQKNSNRLGNFTTIKSETGELVSNENSEVLKLILHKGNYYDDTPPKEYKDRLKRPFKKSEFKTYTINIDLSELNKVDLEEKNYSDKYNMLNIKDLNYTIDSLQQKQNKDYTDFATTLYNRARVDNINKNLQKKSDTTSTNLLDLFTAERSLNVIDLSLNSVKSTNQIISNKERSLKLSTSWLNKHIIALHEKLALGFACIILFFVGAPLGAIIRKGGIGLPMVIAILLFLTYHFIGIFAKNSAKDGSLNPVIASWFSTIIMLPLSIYLTRRATADRGLFEFENFIEPFKKFIPFKNNTSSEYSNAHKVIKQLKKLDNENLIETFKNPVENGFHNSDKPLIYDILKERGFAPNDFELNKMHLPISFTKPLNYKKDYTDYAKFSVVFYLLALSLGVLYFVLENNNLNAVANATIQLTLVFGSISLLYYLISVKILKHFYSFSNLQSRFPNVFLLLVGYLAYPILHTYIKERLQADLKQITYQSFK